MDNMSDSQQVIVAQMIAELASSANVHDQDHGERRARIAAEALAQEVAVLAMMNLPTRVSFYKRCGKLAADLVRRYQ